MFSLNNENKTKKFFIFLFVFTLIYLLTIYFYNINLGNTCLRIYQRSVIVIQSICLIIIAVIGLLSGWKIGRLFDKTILKTTIIYLIINIVIYILISLLLNISLLESLFPFYIFTFLFSINLFRGLRFSKMKDNKY